MESRQLPEVNVSLNSLFHRVPFLQARMPSDESLGFEAATAALGLKANISEAEHPLLCEGTRRQRGELALTLLSFYKDDPVKLAKIMNKVRCFLIDSNNQYNYNMISTLYLLTNYYGVKTVYNWVLCYRQKEMWVFEMKVERGEFSS